MLPRNLVMEAMNFFVLFLQLIDDVIAFPHHLQSKLHFAFHLLQHVFQRRIDGTQNLANIIVCTEHSAETHRDNGVLLHHRLDHVFVGQRILAVGSKIKTGVLLTTAEMSPCATV